MAIASAMHFPRPARAVFQDVFVSCLLQKALTKYEPVKSGLHPSFRQIFLVYLCVFDLSVQDKTYTGRFFSFLRHVQITTLPLSISRRRSKTLLTCLHIRKITNIQFTVSCCLVLSWVSGFFRWLSLPESNRHKKNAVPGKERRFFLSKLRRFTRS